MPAALQAAGLRSWAAGAVITDDGPGWARRISRGDRSAFSGATLCQPTGGALGGRLGRHEPLEAEKRDEELLADRGAPTSSRCSRGCIAEIEMDRDELGEAALRIGRPGKVMDERVLGLPDPGAAWAAGAHRLREPAASIEVGCIDPAVQPEYA